MYSTRNLYRVVTKSLVAVGLLVAVISEVNHNHNYNNDDHSNNIEEKTEVLAGASLAESDILAKSFFRADMPVAGAIESNIIVTSYRPKNKKTTSIDENNIARNKEVRVTDEIIGAGDIIEVSSKDRSIEVERCPYNVPNDSLGCKSYNFTYMGYRAVIDTTSKQYKLLNSSDSWTDPETGLRMYKDRICIALGTYYTADIGTMVDLVLEDGTIVPCVLGDVKSNSHTDSTNRYNSQDGSVAEVIIDYAYFHSSSQYTKYLNGKIQKVVVLDKIWEC